MANLQAILEERIPPVCHNKEVGGVGTVLRFRGQGIDLFRGQKSILAKVANKLVAGSKLS